MVICVGRNAPVLQVLSEIRMQTCDMVAKCLIPCASYGSFKMLKISTSDPLHPEHVRMNFSATVTEGLVHGAFKR